MSILIRCGRWKYVALMTFKYEIFSWFVFYCILFMTVWELGNTFQLKHSWHLLLPIGQLMSWSLVPLKCLYNSERWKCVHYKITWQLRILWNYGRHKIRNVRFMKLWMTVGRWSVTKVMPVLSKDSVPIMDIKKFPHLDFHNMLSESYLNNI